MTKWIDLEPTGRRASKQAALVMTVRRHGGGKNSGRLGRTVWITMRADPHERLFGYRLVAQRSEENDRLLIATRADGPHQLSRIGKHRDVSRLCFRAPEEWPDLSATELRFELAGERGIVALLPDWGQVAAPTAQPAQPAPSPPPSPSAREPAKQPLAAGSRGPELAPFPYEGKGRVAPAPSSVRPKSVAEQLAEFQRKNGR